MDFEKFLASCANVGDRDENGDVRLFSVEVGEGTQEAPGILISRELSSERRKMKEVRRSVGWMIFRLGLAVIRLKREMSDVLAIPSSVMGKKIRRSSWTCW